MTKLWEVLRGDPSADPVLVGSLYLPFGTNPSEAMRAARKRFPDARAVRVYSVREKEWQEIPW